MSNKNSSHGASRLAAVLQERMKSVNNHEGDVAAELGNIGKNNGLRVDSLPGITMDTGDYSTCSSYKPKSGDRVLVIWTNDGEPVVIDKIN